MLTRISAGAGPHRPRKYHWDTRQRVRADRVDTDSKLTLRVSGNPHHIGRAGFTLLRHRILLS